HAFRPYLGFDPAPVAAGGRLLCTLLSHFGTAGASLLWHDLHASTFLPCLPLGGVLLAPPPTARAPGRLGTMRALTPRRLAHTDKASLLPLLCRPSIPPPTTSWTRHH